jgi:cytoskeletal protein RodZ
MAIGARLRRAREERGLSVESLAARTRISSRILHAVERDDFSAIPSGIFVRGYLRACARELGLDPEEVIAEYRSEHEPVAPILPDSGVSAVPPPAPDPATRGAHQSVAIGIGLLVLLAAVSWWSRIGPDSRSPRPGGSQTGQSVAGEDGADTSRRARSAPVVPTSGGPATPSTDVTGLQIELTARSSVWVTAIADGSREVYRLLAPGEKVSLDARRQVTLRVGDAGALLVSVNGSAPAPAGRPGEVRNLDFANQTATP